MEIKLNITMGESFFETSLPIEEDMIIIDFLFSLQVLLNQLYDKATTFDIYDLNFNRIALVGKDEELYIDEKYKHINTIFELIENNVDTLEVIALGTSSVKKVLQEEAYLKEALENYKF